jgi:hypothetical protein
MSWMRLQEFYGWSDLYNISVDILYVKSTVI